MPVISARIHHSLCAKAINHGVQKGWNAAQGHIYLFAREHTKVALSKGFQVQRSKDLFTFSWFIHQHNILDSIDSKSFDPLLLIHIGQKVVVSFLICALLELFFIWWGFCVPFTLHLYYTSVEF